RSPPTPTLFPYTTLFRSCRTFTHGCGAVNSSQLSSIGYGTWTYSIAALRTANPRPHPGPHQGPEQGGLATGVSGPLGGRQRGSRDRKSTRLNSSHVSISY